MLEPILVTKPAFRFVGLHAKFRHGLSPETNASEVIGPLWGRFFPLSEGVEGSVGETRYGVIWGEPEEARSHPHELDYLAAAEVEGSAPVPAGMVERNVPSSRFAVFVHRGTIFEIATTVGRIYREWLPASGYEHSGVADVEVYDERFCHDSEDSEMEYWISIRPVSASEA